MHSRRELMLIYAAAFLRSFGVGLLGVVLGVYLFRIGFDATRIGLVIAAGLAGGTVATLLVSARGDQIGRRRMLVWLSLLAGVGGIGLGFVPSFAPLSILVFIGMLNGMGTDRSAAFALEQAIIPSLVPDHSRTWAFSWYNVLLDAAGALGALAGALPLAIHAWAGIGLAGSYRCVFLAYAGLCCFSAYICSLLSFEVEVSSRRLPLNVVVSHETKSKITKLAALFSLDGFGGGLLGDALVSYWFFRRFGVDERTLGILFFVVHLLNATSHLGAAWLARRIGLVRTMVFTHLPSSLFLIAVPFASGFKAAAALFLLRESLVEMDVPTRQSYVAAIVKPQERTFASGVTNLTRNVSWAAASSVAGALMQNVALAGPLLLGGSLKITYDLLLYRGFRDLKAPEEQQAQKMASKGVHMLGNKMTRIILFGVGLALMSFPQILQAQAAKASGNGDAWKAVQDAMERPESYNRTAHSNSVCPAKI